MKPVAVIILNWNGAALLRRYLPSVIANTNSTIADVIVADNGSTDESVKVLKEEFPEVKTLLFSENWGFADGYNKCVAQTAYKYTVLLNSDVRTPEGWLEPLYEYMEAHSDVGAVQPKLLKDFGPDDPRQVFEYAGAAGGYIDKHGYPYCRGRIFGTVEEDHGQYDGEVTDIFWATGACFMVRSEVYLKVGGLDKDFFAHMEEIDLCWRLLNAGYRNCYIPQSRVYHLGGGSLPQGNPRKTYLNFRNNLLLLHKNLPAKDARVLPKPCQPPLRRCQGDYSRAQPLPHHAQAVRPTCHPQSAENLPRRSPQHHPRILPPRPQNLPHPHHHTIVESFIPNRSLGLVVFRSFKRMNFDCLLMSDSELLRIKNEQKGIL